MALLPLYYTSQKDLEDEIGAHVVRAVLDDDNDGTADGGPVRRLLFNAETYCEGFWRQAGYDIDQLRAAKPAECQRMALERAVGKLFVRHVEIARYDGEKALDRLRKELGDMMKPGGPRLDVPKGAVPAPTNVGGAVGAIGGGPTPESMFSDMGDFCA